MRDLGTASVFDALDMLEAGGIDLASELSNIDAAWADIADELEAQGYSEIGFSVPDLREAIRERLAQEG